jgi:Na+/H+-dicarboxylate symporter
MATKNKNKAAEKTSYKYQLAFSKENYKWMLIGLGVILLGFILMAGKTDDIFNNAEVFKTGEKSFSSTVKVTIAPLVVLLGFVIEIYAIFKKSPEVTNEPD